MKKNEVDIFLGATHEECPRDNQVHYWVASAVLSFLCVAVLKGKQCLNSGA